MRKIYCYTDGSARILKNPTRNGPGGFGTYFPNFFGRKYALSLGFQETKTGRMEVMALLYAIRAFHVNRRERIILTVYSDSQYVTKAFNEGWLKKWKRNNWQNASGEIKNRDLWEKIDEALLHRPFLRLNPIHIKGHQIEKEKDPVKKAEMWNNVHIVGNMVADKLADYKRHKNLLKSDKII